MSDECQNGEHKLVSYWVRDADGFPLSRVCDSCREKTLEKYRPDILTRSSRGEYDWGSDEE
jgi:hypothetical protein